MPSRPRSWGWAIKKSSYAALLDACVLYPAPLRDLLVELASGGELYRAKWTLRIHGEWMRNVLVSRPDLKPAALKRTCDLMNEAVQDCLVEDYEGLIDGLNLPDMDDRHVLAAAIHASADAIVTFNLKDFPAEKVGKYQIEVLHPDDFIFHQVGIDDAAVLTSVQAVRARLKNPPISADRYLDILEQQGLSKTVGYLRAYAAII